MALIVFLLSASWSGTLGVLHVRLADSARLSGTW
jgi:hypothetical protein